MSYVAWVSELIMNYGIAKEALLEGSGLESLDFSDPEGRVSDAQHICLLRNAMQLCADPALALALGAHRPISTFGSLGFDAHKEPDGSEPSVYQSPSRRPGRVGSGTLQPKEGSLPHHFQVAAGGGIWVAARAVHVEGYAGILTAMSNLTTFLQRQFIEQCPDQWTCVAEREVLSKELSDLLSFRSRADVLLARKDGSLRIWIEFEISRADPVANHAKFATAHIFEPKASEDVFLSMVTSHVTRGRHNLAAASIYLLRRIGIQAFQTMLLPEKCADEIKVLNHLPMQQLMADSTLAVAPEIDRALSIAAPIAALATHRIFFACNLLEVMLNLRQWNKEMQSEPTRALWGRRTVTYFVCDPRSRRFAPAKFCAFTPANSSAYQSDRRGAIPPTMNIATYAMLDESDTRFDGAIARRHLCHRLSLRELRLDAAGAEIACSFYVWIRDHADSINIHPRGPIVLMPAPWWT